LHPFGVAKSSTSFGWGKGGKVTSAGWQVTLSDPIWYVISRCGEVKFTKLLYPVYFTLLSLSTGRSALHADQSVAALQASEGESPVLMCGSNIGVVEVGEAHDVLRFTIVI